MLSHKSTGSPSQGWELPQWSSGDFSFSGLSMSRSRTCVLHFPYCWPPVTTAPFSMALRGSLTQPPPSCGWSPGGAPSLPVRAASDDTATRTCPRRSSRAGFPLPASAPGPHLGGALAVPDDAVQVLGDVGVQAAGQVPGLADPVVVLAPRSREVS